jgi:hypothetical protein
MGFPNPQHELPNSKQYRMIETQNSEISRFEHSKIRNEDVFRLPAQSLLALGLQRRQGARRRQDFDSDLGFSKDEDRGENGNSNED